MRILCVTSSFPRTIEDIAGRFVCDFNHHLIQTGDRVDVLTWDDRPCEFHSKRRTHAIRSSQCSESSTPGFVRRLPYRIFDAPPLFYGAGAPDNIEEDPTVLLHLPAALLTMFWALLKAVLRAKRRNSPYDLIVGHWLVPSGALVRLVGRITKTPHLVIAHSAGIHLAARLPQPLKTSLYSLLQQGPMTVPTQVLADKLHHTGYRGPIKVVPMGFVPPLPINNSARHDTNHGGLQPHIRPGPHFFQLPRARQFLVLGRLTPVKGVDTALLAWQMAALGKEHVLHIAGDGPERPKLEALARSFSSHSPVRFHGFVTGAAKADLVQQCDIALLPSRVLMSGRTEGLPTSLLELMYSGLVPLVADLEAFQSFLTDPQLQQLPRRDPLLWAAHFRRMCHLPENAFGALSTQSRSLAGPLSWPLHITQWKRYLHSVVSSSRR